MSMFILVRQYNQAMPQEVRISSNGNLVDIDSGMTLRGREAERDSWPTIYTTADAAWRAQEERESQCEHEWHTVSHEERACRLCGANEFVMDTSHEGASDEPEYPVTLPDNAPELPLPIGTRVVTRNNWIGTIVGKRDGGPAWTGSRFHYILHGRLNVGSPDNEQYDVVLSPNDIQTCQAADEHA